MSPAPTLFDVPRSRHSDPLSSAEAAAVMKPGNEALYAAILREVSPQRFPRSAFDLATRVQIVHPGRWDESSIRTAVSRLGKQGKLVKTPVRGLSPRGRQCDTWRLP